MQDKPTPTEDGDAPKTREEAARELALIVGEFESAKQGSRRGESG